MSPDQTTDRPIQDHEDEYYKPDELEGQLAAAPDEYEKLARTLIDDDGSKVEAGELLNAAINQGVGNFIPDMMFNNLTKNFKNAKQMYGERMLRRLTGWSADYIERNIRIPEFARELQGRISQKIEALKDQGMLDRAGMLTDDAIRLSALVLYMQELDNIVPKGIVGEKEHKQISQYGQSGEMRPYRRGDRFRDIALKQTIKVTARRGHKRIMPQDLRMHERESKGAITIIYAVDASGSMRGDKIEMAKRAGIALAFKAIDDRNKTGLLVFSAEVEESVPPTLDFWTLLPGLTCITPFNETNVARTIRESIKMFPEEEATKHLIFLTDAAPTSGADPQQEALSAAAQAAAQGITISVLGIQVDAQSETFARQLAEVGGGNFYLVSNLADLDKAVLEDYARTKEA